MHECFHMVGLRRITIKHGMYAIAMHVHNSVNTKPITMSDHICAVLTSEVVVELFILCISFVCVCIFKM